MARETKSELEPPEPPEPPPPVNFCITYTMPRENRWIFEAGLVARRTHLHGSSTTHGTGAQVAGRSLVVGLLVGILHMAFVDRLAVVLQSQRPEVRQSVKR